MSQTQSATVAKEDLVDLPKLLPIICQLMTLYAMRLCEPIATNINRYLKLALNSSEVNSVGEWQNTLQQLLSQWEVISKRHNEEMLTAVNMEMKEVIAH